MKKFIVLANKKGGFDMTDYQRTELGEYLRVNAGKRMRVVVEPATVESGKQRRFYHGAVIPLWAYLDGRDYKNSIVLEMMHEIAKDEFNAEIVVVAGRTRRVGMSTKGKLREFLDKVIDYMVENYGLNEQHVYEKILNPERYKIWRDTIFPSGGPENYIDYLLSLKILK